MLHLRAVLAGVLSIASLLGVSPSRRPALLSHVLQAPEACATVTSTYGSHPTGLGGQSRLIFHEEQ